MSFALLCGILTFAGEGRAQVAPTTQCGQYVEAYHGGSSAYAAYLQAAAQVAKSRDAQEGVSRYSSALQASAPSANALWLSNWCGRNPLRGFTEASSRLLDELTGPGQASPGPAPVVAGPPPQIVVVAPQAVQPSACRVGDVGSCSGCSVACGNGSTAKCKPGSTMADGQSCAFQSKCECNFPKNGAPAANAGVGSSSCRVGDNGLCSGCSVTCNSGTAKCKQGSLTASGDRCAFQASCNCK